MAKPPEYPNWATDLSNNTAPLAGQRATGWTPNQAGVSSYDNWFKYRAFQWIQYFDRRLVDQSVRELVAMLDSTDSSALDFDFPAQSRMTSSIYAMTLHGGSAYLKQGSANAKLKISAGTLLQLRDDALYAYQMDGTTEVTIGAGDASNPRVDIVQMKLDVDDATQAPTITINVKQGTPAASPVYPAPDAGYCVVAGVVVGAAYAGAAGFVWGDDTAGAVAVVHDQRFPVGVRTDTVMPIASMFGTDFELHNANRVVKKATNGANGVLDFPYPGGNVARLLAVRQGALMYRQQDSRLSKLYYDEAGIGTTSIGYTDLAGAGMDGSASPAFTTRTSGLLGFQLGTRPLFAAGPTVQANANGMGPPIWTNGRRCANPHVANSNETHRTSVLSLRYVAPGTSDQDTEWGPATFYTCEGL